MNTQPSAAIAARFTFLSRLRESTNVPLSIIANIVEQAGKPIEFDRVIIAVGKGRTEEELARLDFTNVDAAGRPSFHLAADPNLVVSSFAWLDDYPTTAPRDLIAIVNIEGSEETPRC